MDKLNGAVKSFGKADAWHTAGVKQASQDHTILQQVRESRGSAQEVSNWLKKRRTSASGRRPSTVSERGIRLMQLQDFETVGALGEGNFGLVLLLRNKETRAEYALKGLNKQHLEEAGCVMRPPDGLWTLQISQKKMVITFERRDGTEKDVEFYHRPIGLECSGTEPIVVQRVRKNTAAEKALVRVNWVVRAVDGLRAPADLMSLMQARAGELAEEPKASQVVLTFTPPDELKLVDVTFQHQPWGVMFTKSVPVRVKGCRPESYSERLGVQKGWHLVSVDGEQLPERMTDIMQLIQEKVSTLPEKQEGMLKNERNILSMLDSPFIIQLHGCYHDSKFVFFLLEVALGGELFDLYNEYDLWGRTDTAQFYIACVALGLSHIHSKHIVWRDLKLENCLVNSQGYAKLADMGIAKMVTGKTYTVCGTADYFAPETLKQVGHNRAADWWALGVMLFIMLAGHSPFDAPEVTQIYKNIIKGFSKVQFPPAFPKEAEECVRSLCRKKPEDRLTMQRGGISNLMPLTLFDGLNWEEVKALTMKPPWIPPEPDYEKIAARKLSRPIDIQFDELSLWLSHDDVPQLPGGLSAHSLENGEDAQQEQKVFEPVPMPDTPCDKNDLDGSANVTSGGAARFRCQAAERSQVERQCQQRSDPNVASSDFPVRAAKLRSLKLLLFPCARQSSANAVCKLPSIGVGRVTVLGMHSILGSSSVSPPRAGSGGIRRLRHHAADIEADVPRAGALVACLSALS
ncbi:PRKG1 [Symbiodinium sp. CCMP2592]|nr:PRKG1 [Symbiodinium sp. CCMP2592]